MAKFNLKINNQSYTIEADPSTPLLWVIRDHVGLKGTKFGCGIAQCGACTVHIDGNPIRSCVMPVSAINGQEIITIEGISTNNNHPVQEAWMEAQVPQCGYCQSGQIMSATVLLERKPNPTDEDINQAMKGNICRCGTYPRIKKAIRSASNKLNNGNN